MRSHDASLRSSMRVHAIILTQDRTEVLRRCVHTAIALMGPQDALTVLDDSCEAITHANAGVLAAAALRSRAHLMHLKAEQLHEAIRWSAGGVRALWQFKTAKRDIAPLRNLSLLLSAAVDAHTTVLIDDDICGFDLDATHRLLDAHHSGTAGVIAGSEISGTTEQDTVTRLSDAMRLLETKAHNTVESAEELFGVPLGSDKCGSDRCRWVSAGYMAFRLPPARLFAFPPGYNEDWLWCLLHDAGGKVTVLRTNQSVVHEPPVLRRPKRDDIVFELAGDLVLDCLAKGRDGRHRAPVAVLRDLALSTPATAVMPLSRAKAVLEQARRLSTNEHRHVLRELESYGLRVLRDILLSGDLELVGNRMLSTWTSDATAKHKSFTATIRTASAPAAIRTMLRERSL